MLYAKQTQTGFHITVLSTLLPNTSFTASGPDTQWLAQQQIYPVEEFLYYDAKQTKRVSIDPILRDGFVYTAALIDLTQEEKLELRQQELNMLADSVRQQRQRLLFESDWTQVADAPVDQAAWAEYRQVLRDITTQENFPATVLWPQMPAN